MTDHSTSLSLRAVSLILAAWGGMGWYYYGQKTGLWPVSILFMALAVISQFAAWDASAKMARAHAVGEVPPKMYWLSAMLIFGTINMISAEHAWLTFKADVPELLSWMAMAALGALAFIEPLFGWGHQALAIAEAKAQADEEAQSLDRIRERDGGLAKEHSGLAKAAGLAGLALVAGGSGLAGQAAAATPVEHAPHTQDINGNSPADLAASRSKARSFSPQASQMIKAIDAYRVSMAAWRADQETIARPTVKNIARKHGVDRGSLRDRLIEAGIYEAPQQAAARLRA